MYKLFKFHLLEKSAVLALFPWGGQAHPSRHRFIFAPGTPKFITAFYKSINTFACPGNSFQDNTEEMLALMRAKSHCWLAVINQEHQAAPFTCLHLKGKTHHWNKTSPHLQMQISPKCSSPKGYSILSCTIFLLFSA